MELNFIKLNNTHAEELLPIWQDLEVTRFTYIKNINNLEDVNNKIDYCLNYCHGIIGPYVVLENNKIIGFAGGMSPEDNQKISEIFFHLSKTSWRKGYGTQTINFLLTQGFDKLNLEVIKAQAVTENVASWQLLEKMGFTDKTIIENGFKNEKDIYSYSFNLKEYKDLSK